jgi:predicted nucleotidyltransferase
MLITSTDPVLNQFRTAVTARYGDRVERIVLFGSRARGDQRQDSDYDIAVFLNDLGPLWSELDSLAAIATDIFYDTGAIISAKPFSADSYSERTALMQEIRRDGFEL